MSSDNKQNEQRTRDNQIEQRQQREDRSGVILFELGSESRNTNPHLSCAEGAYRGIHKRSNRSVNERMSFENEGIPDLPGFHIEIDIKNRRLNLYDPLGRAEFKKTRRELESALENPQPGVQKRTFKPKEDRVTENCSSDLMFKWLIELYSLVEDGQAQVRKGEFPQTVIQRIEANRQKAAALQWGAEDPLPQLV